MRNSETVFDLARALSELEPLRARAAAPDFWSDPAEAARVSQEISRREERFSLHKRLEGRLSDAQTLAELAQEENDEAARAEASAEADALAADIARALLEASFTGPHDASRAILHIHAGAGGHDACGWAEMLVRMYLRWAEAEERAVEVFDKEEGEETGIKGQTFLVAGPHAYGWLKGEAGIHRLVRISPFSGKRETSFASVEALPEIEEAGEVEIRPEDLRVDTFRSSGPGGQHVNKTDSAIRITHLPTGIVVACQTERSQHKNRANAMKLLASHLYERQRVEKEAELAKLAGKKSEIGWGNQIRSYVLHPYQLVKDHRTDEETSNTTRVLDGAIGAFLEANLRARIRA